MGQTIQVEVVRHQNEGMVPFPHYGKAHTKIWQTHQEVHFINCNTKNNPPYFTYPPPVYLNQYFSPNCRIPRKENAKD